MDDTVQHYVLIAACACLVIVLGGCMDDSGPSTTTTRGDLHAQGCPSAEPVLGPPRATATRSRRALRGEFRVYGFRADLEPPVDWSMDPHGSLRFQAYLSNWAFMEPLFGGYLRTQDPAFLRKAAELALDWVRANPRGSPAGGPGTWSGKIAGDRAPRLAYLLHADRCAKALGAGERRLLRAALRDHLAILLGPESSGDTNHALYVQLGLAAVARQLPQLQNAERVLAVAERRFQEILESRLADGVWLEHSTSYQFLAIRVAERFRRLIDSRVGRLDLALKPMKRAAAWLTAPDGRHTLFGDSRQVEAPADIQRIAESQDGLKVFPRAGFAAVRDGKSHLVISAGFHNTTHKHADELSFELSHEGRRLVADTGMYHKDPGEIRDFVVSAPAHNTLTVDGMNFGITDGTRAYGSGLEAWGSGAGWHAVLAENPLLAEHGIAHQRLFLYRPEDTLLVADRATSNSRREFNRYVQLAPELRATRSGSALKLRAPGFEGVISDLGRGSSGKIALARGNEEPLAGYTAADYREWEPRTTARFTNRGRGLRRALALTLDGPSRRSGSLRWGDRRMVVRLGSAAGMKAAIEIRRQGSSLRVRDVSRSR